MKTTTQFVLILILLLFPGLLIKLQAVNPAPDGCYPSFTTAEGCEALKLLSTGAANTGLGWRSLFSDTAGSYNTAVGAGALILNNADSNIAVGTAALLLNTSGTENTAIGTAAIVYDDSGSYNTAIGAFALSNSTAGFNTAVGDRTLFNNTIGDSNVAVGIGGPGGPALFSNTTGRFNTAVGGGALYTNTQGGDNTAIGAGALADNIVGNENVAVGLNALLNSTGNNNVALGNLAGYSHHSGDNNIYIGYQVGSSGNESNACYIGSIFGQTAAVGSSVYIDGNGKLGTMTSSKRYKEGIKPIDTASSSLFALNPVTFRYKKEIDPTGTSQFGLVAEDVEKLNPDLIVRDKDGKPNSVRYDQVNTMLLNEFLKEHKRVEEQQATIAELKSEMRSLAETVHGQALELRQVKTEMQIKSSASVIAGNH